MSSAPSFRLGRRRSRSRRPRSLSSTPSSSVGRLDRRSPNELREALQRLLERERPDALLPPEPLDAEGVRLAVEERLDAPDELVAAEDRQDVVAVLPFPGRDVHLEAVSGV